jgi:hypothetical protein
MSRDESNFRKRNETTPFYVGHRNSPGRQRVSIYLMTFADVMKLFYPYF